MWSMKSPLRRKRPTNFKSLLCRRQWCPRGAEDDLAEELTPFVPGEYEAVEPWTTEGSAYEQGAYDLGASSWEEPETEMTVKDNWPGDQTGFVSDGAEARPAQFEEAAAVALDHTPLDIHEAGDPWTTIIEELEALFIPVAEAAEIHPAEATGKEAYPLLPVHQPVSEPEIPVHNRRPAPLLPVLETLKDVLQALLENRSPAALLAFLWLVANTKFAARLRRRRLARAVGTPGKLVY
jgi:hypothetical protein